MKFKYLILIFIICCANNLISKHCLLSKKSGTAALNLTVEDDCKNCNCDYISKHSDIKKEECEKNYNKPECN